MERLLFFTPTKLQTIRMQSCIQTAKTSMKISQHAQIQLQAENRILKLRGKTKTKAILELTEFKQNKKGTKPWNPFPIVIPETSTRSPSLKSSLKSMRWLGSNPSTDCRRNSCRWRIGITPAFWRCPNSGLVSFRSLTLRYPTWTALYPSVASVLTCVTMLPSLKPTTVTGTTLPSGSKKLIIPSLVAITPMPASMLIQIDRPWLVRVAVLGLGNCRRSEKLLRWDLGGGSARKEVLSLGDEEEEGLLLKIGWLVEVEGDENDTTAIVAALSSEIHVKKKKKKNCGNETSGSFSYPLPLYGKYFILFIFLPSLKM